MPKLTAKQVQSFRDMCDDYIYSQHKEFETVKQFTYNDSICTIYTHLIKDSRDGETYNHQFYIPGDDIRCLHSFNWDILFDKEDSKVRTKTSPFDAAAISHTYYFSQKPVGEEVLISV